MNRAHGDDVLRVEGVTVTFSGFKALDGLSLSLKRGELRVVIGPNGAGKTTLLDVITGKVRPRAGRVLFNGEDVTRLPEQVIARRGIGRKFQTPNVFKSLTALDNLLLSMRGRRGVFASLFSRACRQRRDEAVATLDKVGLVPRMNVPAGQLAHGEKQRLELAMVLAQNPELLLIDEPVAGMTPRESEQAGELLLSVARSHALLVIDHDMTFVRQIARTVTVLHEGRTLCEGSVDEVQRDPRVIEVYLGNHKEGTNGHAGHMGKGVGRVRPAASVAVH